MGLELATSSLAAGRLEDLELAAVDAGVVERRPAQGERLPSSAPSASLTIGPWWVIRT